MAASQGLPHVDYTPSYERQLYSSKGFLSLIEPAPNGKPTFDLFTNALSASWELDLFGRVRRSVEAQRANTEAAIEARNEIALSELSDLASDYMMLRGVQTREAITRHNLELMRHNDALIRTRQLNGVATTLDVAQADGEVATAAATLPPLVAQEAAMINAIGLLLALPPRALEAELQPAQAIPVAPIAVPVGVPSELIRRRPDVRRAEAALHAATAETGVAVAEFYPDLTVMGSFGNQGLNFADMFSLPDREFTLGPTLDLPLFKGGQLTGQLHIRKSQQREAALAYRRTVLQAWTDVDNAMTAYAQAQAQRTEVERALGSDRNALAGATQQYQQGAVDFLNVITAENALLQVQNAMAESDTAIDTDLVALYRALGGGWDQAALPAGVPEHAVGPGLWPE